MTTRRVFLLGAYCTLAASGSEADTSLAAIEATLQGGRLGVAALDTGSGARIAHRGNERFAMASTFKWLLIAAVLREVERGSVTLERRLPYNKADLLQNSPVTSASVGEGALSVAQLCEAAVTVSDNTAANLLLAQLGGPAAFTRFVRTSGDAVTRLDRNEIALNENRMGDVRDTTTPAAMLESLQRVLLGDVLSESSRTRLGNWMVASSTGLTLLRAGLPQHWRVGDKSGRGGEGAVNDVAIAWPAERKPLLIACYTSEGEADANARSAAHAAVARLITRNFRN